MGHVRSVTKPRLSRLSRCLPAPFVRRPGKKLSLPAMSSRIQVTPKKAVVSQREQKKIEAAATSAINAVGLVVDVAIEKEIEYVTGKLRDNRELLFTVSSLLKSDSLQALLDGRTKELRTDDTEESPGKPGRKLTLRKTVRRWKHLDKQPRIQIEIIKSLEPRFIEVGAFIYMDGCVCVCLDMVSI